MKTSWLVRAFTISVTLQWLPLVYPCGSVDFIDGLIDETKPRNVVLYTDNHNGSSNRKYFNCEREIFRNLSRRVPTTAVDIRHPPPFWVLKDGGYFGYHKDFTASLHLLMLYQPPMFKDYSEYARMVWVQAWLSLPYMTGTKFFLVLFKCKNNSEDSKAILKTVWDWSFKDLTIIEVNQKGNEIIKMYVDYPRVITVEEYSRTRPKYFPKNKKNLAGYTLRVGVINGANYNNNLDLDPKFIVKLHLRSLLTTFVEHVNATYKLVGLEHNQNQLRALQKLNLDLILDEVSLENIVLPSWCDIIADNRLFAVIPLMHEEFIDFSFRKFLAATLGLACLTVLMMGARTIFNYQSPRSYFEIFQLLLGVGVDNQPRRFQSRIAYITLALFSVFGVSEVVDVLTQISLASTDVPLVNSVEEIIQKNATVCTAHSPGYLLQFQPDNPTDERLKILKQADDRRCIYNETTEWYNADILILTRTDAFRMALLHKKFGNLDLHVLELDFPILLRAMLHHPTSPFKQELHQFNQRMYEFGIDKEWASRYKVKRFKDESNPLEEDQYALLLSLILVLTVGYTAGCIALVFERHLSVPRQQKFVFARIFKKT